MKIPPQIVAQQPELMAIRRDIHANPETAFEELRTSNLVAAKLESWGIEVHKGLAKTGIVGKLAGGRKPGRSARAIGLRADMDALPIHEKNAFGYRSKNDGRMHADYVKGKSDPASAPSADAETVLKAKILALIEASPQYYTEIDKKLPEYDFVAIARAFGQLHQEGKLWKDSVGRICIRGSKFDAKPL